MPKDKGRWKGVNYKARDSSGNVDRAFNVTIVKQDYLDQDYTIDIPMVDSNTTYQGLLVVGSLEPKTDVLPRFSFRWDEKDQHLNVDIEGVSAAEQQSFINGINGYSGHEFHKVPNSGRLFDIDIRIPNKHVFKGRLRFNLAYSNKCIVGIAISATANATVSQ